MPEVSPGGHPLPPRLRQLLAPDPPPAQGNVPQVQHWDLYNVVNSARLPRDTMVPRVAGLKGVHLHSYPPPNVNYLKCKIPYFKHLSEGIKVQFVQEVCVHTYRTCMHSPLLLPVQVPQCSQDQALQVDLKQ